MSFLRPLRTALLIGAAGIGLSACVAYDPYYGGGYGGYGSYGYYEPAPYPYAYGPAPSVNLGFAFDGRRDFRERGFRR